jgi:hypothetical protein
MIERQLLQGISSSALPIRGGGDNIQCFRNGERAHANLSTFTANFPPLPVSDISDPHVEPFGGSVCDNEGDISDFHVGVRDVIETSSSIVAVSVSAVS